MEILLADYVIPVSGPTIRDAGVAIDGERIIDVGDQNYLLTKYPTAIRHDFGAAAILPGFVNCHSHLELTALRGALCGTENDFRSWLLRVNQLRAEAGADNLLRWAIAGAREAAAAGITTLGDVGRFGEIGLSALKEAGLRGIIYQETEFSPDNRTAEADFRKIAEKFEKLFNQRSNLIAVGLSPHSPYTVSSRLFELIAEYSIINRIPIAVHAAESLAETDLMLYGKGFFADIFAHFGFEWDSPGLSSLEYLEKTGVLAARPLLIHCVNVNRAEIDKAGAYGASIAHCPKSNAKLGHGVAPLEDFLDSGITVGLGSDSVASNNLCDLIEEARFAVLVSRNRPQRKNFISAEKALEIATLGGARALRLENEIGSLEPGKQADISIVSFSSPAVQPVNDPISAVIFAASGRDVVRTYVAGKCVFDRLESKAAIA